MDLELTQYLTSLTDPEKIKRVEYAAQILPTLIDKLYFEDGYSQKKIVEEAFAYADALTKKAKEEDGKIMAVRKEKEEGKKKLIAWARDNGSASLKRSINALWLDAYRQAEPEFLEAHIPEGFSVEAYTDYASTGARGFSSTEIEFDARRELIKRQKKNPEIYRNIKLVWASYSNDSGETIAHQGVLQVDVVTPTFRSFTVAKAFPETRKEVRT